MAFEQYSRTKNENLKFDEDDDGNTVVRIRLVV